MTYGITNAGGGKSAELGTKSITANGTYSASTDNLDGYSQVTVNVPAQLPTVTAKNTAFTTLATGDKVFLNTFNSQASDTPVSSYTTEHANIITPDGNYLIGNLSNSDSYTSLYAINSDLTTTLVAGLNNNWYAPAYFIENGVVYCTDYDVAFPCLPNSWQLSNCIFCGTSTFVSAVVSSGARYTYYEIDPHTGEKINTFTSGSTFSYSTNNAILYIGNDRFMRYYTNSGWYMDTLDRDNDTFTSESIVSFVQSAHQTPLAYYKVGSTEYMLALTSAGGAFGYNNRLKEINITNKQFSASLPDAMSRFLDKNEVYGYYNKDTRNLMLTRSSSTDYGVFHLNSDGTWIELNVTITNSSNFPAGPFVSFSSDLSRACWRIGTTKYIQQLETIEGYTASSFSTQKASANTSTGIVQTGGVGGANVTVAAILPDEALMTMNSPDTLSSFRVNGEEV